MSMNMTMCQNIMQRMNFTFYFMIGGAAYLLTLYLSKTHLMQYSSTVVITSMELGMGFAVVCHVLMVISGMWPIRLAACLVDQFPEEEILLNHLCLKWDIDTNMNKLLKMT